MKILVVEDTEDSRVLLEDELQFHGNDVDSATNGIEALERLHSSQPDLIISDILMPEMDGFALCREVKKDEQLRKIPFIFYTATYLEQKDEELAMSLGASRYIFKPTDIKHFLQIIDEVMREYREGYLPIPEQPLKSNHDLDVMHTASLTHKLDDKLKELEREHEALKQSEAKLRILSQAVEQSPASVVITDPEGTIEYVNKKFTAVTGYSSAEAIGGAASILKSGQTSDEEYKQLWDTITTGKEWRGELSNITKDGELFWEYATIAPIRESDGTITHFLAIKEDISLRKEYEEQLLHQANFDELTGLPNRVLVLDRLSQALTMAHREENTVVVMYIDLDNFKYINDTMGHAIGDICLVEASKRLIANVREGNTVARLGGDEFLVILNDLDSAKTSEAVAEKILAAFTQPFSINGQNIYITASIGITVYPADGSDAHVLLRNADAAVHMTKAKGRNTYSYFMSSMNIHAAKRLEMESELRQALEQKELSLHYQPLVDISSGELLGAEALLRWENHKLGAVPPLEFITLAEETGLIIPIGEWVLQSACHEAIKWQQEGQPLVRVAVNISSRQLRKDGKDLLSIITQALEESGLSPECLELEVTENALMEDVQEAGRQLKALSELGVSLSIDDFGTGYSSLSYLKRFPFNTLKIDREFVRDVMTDASNAALASAIIVMAHSLGLKVIAEGVEDVDQLKFLREQGSDIVQGYYFSKPIPAENFYQLASSGKRFEV